MSSRFAFVVVILVSVNERETHIQNEVIKSEGINDFVNARMKMMKQQFMNHFTCEHHFRCEILEDVF